VIAAALAGQGQLSPWGVALAGWGGAVLGDNIGYLVGHHYGRRLATVPVLRTFFDERRMAVAEAFFERRGGVAAVFFGRWVAFLRIFAGPLAGISHMPWPRFLAANAAGGAVWVGIVTTIGVLLGSQLDRAVTIVTNTGYVGLGLAAVLLLAGGIWYLRRHRGSASRDG
jgi:membrane protein DedA with SNARE-associated domain